ncbi:unnamed protein product [Closterium sp. NIES-64]|nr:unnamed protein product [Closterium sp. NIES-64]
MASTQMFSASSTAVLLAPKSSLGKNGAIYTRESGGGFFPGFILGGVVFGALGYLFAPQISKAILGINEEGSAPKLPKWISESDSLEEKRRKMNEKLAELNRAIDKTSAELKGSDFAEAPTNRRTPNVDHIEAI